MQYPFIFLVTLVICQSDKTLLLVYGTQVTVKAFWISCSQPPNVINFSHKKYIYLINITQGKHRRHLGFIENCQLSLNFCLKFISKIIYRAINISAYNQFNKISVLQLSVIKTIPQPAPTASYILLYNMHLPSHCPLWCNRPVSDNIGQNLSYLLSSD